MTENTFTLSMKTANAAFEVPQAEVARILRELAARVADGPVWAGGNLFDINGHKVGTWALDAQVGGDWLDADETTPWD